MNKKHILNPHQPGYFLCGIVAEALTNDQGPEPCKMCDKMNKSQQLRIVRCYWNGKVIRECLTRKKLTPEQIKLQKESLATIYECDPEDIRIEESK